MPILCAIDSLNPKVAMYLSGYRWPGPLGPGHLPQLPDRCRWLLCSSSLHPFSKKNETRSQLLDMV